MKLFVPFDLGKSDDEQRIVEGYASTEALDSQGEIVKREAMERALPDWLKFGNIREMHQPSAVGVAVTAEHDDTGLKLCAKIVDPLAWEKVKAGVYKGFSIGGRVTNRDKANKSIITGLHLTEISLVDRPANPEALFGLWKADGTPAGDGDMSKGMYAVQLLASLVEQVNCLTNHSKAEEAMEGDTDSVVPAELQAIMGQLTQTLNDMVAEETAELMQDHQTPAPVEVIVLAESSGDIDKADGAQASGEAHPGNAEKRGARNSSSDQKKLNDAHDAIVSAGAQCEASKHEHAADLSKATDDLASANEQLAKVNADLAAAEAQVTETENRLADTTKAHTETATALAELTEAQEALTKAQEALTRERDDLASKNETLTSEKSVLATELDALKKEIEELKAKPEPMKGKLLAVAKGDEVAAAPQKSFSTTAEPEVETPPQWFTAR